MLNFYKFSSREDIDYLVVRGIFDEKIYSVGYCSSTISKLIYYSNIVGYESFFTILKNTIDNLRNGKIRFSEKYLIMSFEYPKLKKITTNYLKRLICKKDSDDLFIYFRDIDKPDPVSITAYKNSGYDVDLINKIDITPEELFSDIYKGMTLKDINYYNASNIDLIVRDYAITSGLYGIPERFTTGITLENLKNLIKEDNKPKII